MVILGCLEQRCSDTANEKTGDLVVLWLDLADVCRIIEDIHQMVISNYKDFKMQVSTSDTSNWHSQEKRIITRSIISPILFNFAMNLVVKTAVKECRGPKSKSGINQPPIRAYIDYHTVITKSVVGARRHILELDKHIKWARMELKGNNLKFKFGEANVPLNK